jgi:hypothetical protein
MKKITARITIIIAFASLYSFSPAADVPVRVFHEGKTVDGLQKTDFKLFEDNEPRTIAEVRIKRKKIAAAASQQDLPRYFILVSQLTDYNAPMQKGTAYFIDNIPGKNDRLTIMANGRKLFFDFSNTPESNKADIRSQVDGFLAEQSKLLRESMQADLEKIQESMDRIRNRTARESDPNGQGAVHLHYYMKYIRFSLDQYTNALSDYKNKYLVPGLDEGTYSELLKPLENIAHETWIIYFYQAPRIPELSRRNRDMLRKLITDMGESYLSDENYYSELFEKMLGSIDDLFNGVPDIDVMVKDISRVFYGGGVTFNAIFFKNANKKLLENKKYHRLSADMSRGLGLTAGRTGGTFIAVENIADELIPAIQAIENKEDIYYLLTFTPKNPVKAGKIVVETVNERYNVFFNDNESVYVPVIALGDVTFKNKKLSVLVKNFLRQETEKGKTGQIMVRIYIENKKDGKLLFDESKTMLSGQDEVRVSLLFKWLGKGNYDIGVEVIDLLTGKRAGRILREIIR